MGAVARTLFSFEGGNREVFSERTGPARTEISAEPEQEFLQPALWAAEAKEPPSNIAAANSAVDRLKRQREKFTFILLSADVFQVRPDRSSYDSRTELVCSCRPLEGS